MGEVEWLAFIRGDREMERSSVDLRDRSELWDAEVLPGDQFRPPEPELRIVEISSRNKDRAVIYRNGDYVLGITEWVAPERRWEKFVADELGILGLIQ